MDLLYKIDKSLRLFVSVILFGILLLNGTLMEAVIPPNLVINYSSRIWQILSLVIVLLAGFWCPTVGILAGGIYLMYMLDMETLTKPIKV